MRVSKVLFPVTCLLLPVTLVAGSYSQSSSKSFGFGASEQNNCRLQIIREGQGRRGSFNAGVTPRPGVRLNQRRSVRESNSVAMLVIGNGLRGSIEVDGETVSIRCRILSGSVELEISLASYEGPPVSATRLGTSRRAKSGLSTSISVSRGQQVEIGSVVRNLRDRETRVGTGGVSQERRRRRMRERVFVKVL